MLTGTRLQTELDRTYDNLRTLAETEAGSLAGGALADRVATT